MSEIGDMWKEDRILKQGASAQRRLQATIELEKKGIRFTVHNGGAHLIVEGLFGGYIDFWPGTGKWKVRESTHDGSSVGSLFRYLGVN